MLIAFVLILLWLGAVAGFVAWIRSGGTGVASWHRLAGFLVVAAALIMVLGVWNRPNPGLIREVADARRHRSGAVGEVDCPSALRAQALIGRISDGRIELRDDARLRLAESLWTGMGAGQREALVTLAARVGDCRGADTSGPVLVVDADSGRVLAEPARAR